MAESTSVGKIQLDVEISKESLNVELNKIGKVFSSGLNNSFRGMFSGMANQMNSFVKDSIGKMTNSFKHFSQSGASSNKQVAKSTEDTSIKMQQLVNQMESATNRAELHRQKLLELQAQYDRLSSVGLGDSDKAKKLLEKITLAEDKVNRYGTVSDRTRLKIEQLEKSMNNLGQSVDKSDKSFNKVSSTTNKAKRSFKLFGNEADKSSKKVGGFANMLTNSFMRVLKRIFILNLIYKGIRGLINYMNSALKTNKNFVSSLNTVKTNLRVAFQPIYDFILPALNALIQSVARVTTYIASAISALFGKSYKQSYDSAKGIETAKKAMDGYGASAKKAKGQLMGFDEVNQLDISDDEAGEGFEMEMPDTSTVDMTGVEKFKEIMASIFEPFKKAWETEGLNTINAAKYALDSLKGVIGAIGKSWLDVWTNGTGQKILENVLKIIQNILNTVGNLATAFKNAWETNEVGTRIIQGILDIFNIILGTIERITRATAGWAKTLDFTPLLNSIDTLLQALQPLTQNIGDGLVWFWENALLPIAGWVIKDAVPIFLDMLSEAIKVLNNVIDALKPLGQWLWDNFLKPLAEWTGGIVISVLEGIRDALKGIGEWIKNHQGVIQTMAIIVGSFAAAWGLVNVAIGVWNVIGPIASGVMTAISTSGGIMAAVMNAIVSPITIAVAAIGAVIAVGILLYKNWDEISAWLKDLWEGIKTKAEEIWGAIRDFFSQTWEVIKTKTSEVWNGIKTFLENTIWNPIKTTATNIWNGIKSAISTVTDAIKINIDKFGSAFKNTWDKIWSSAKEVFDKMWNSLTDIVKSVINHIIGIVNKFIDFWNKIELKVPKVNLPFVGEVGGFSIGVPKLDNIPMLARGGIIDQPTLAMVGERGKEAVVPLENTAFVDALASAIGSAVMAAMQMGSNLGGRSNSTEKEVAIYLDGRKVGRGLLQYINDELDRLGYKTLFQVE